MVVRRGELIIVSGVSGTSKVRGRHKRILIKIINKDLNTL